MPFILMGVLYAVHTDVRYVLFANHTDGCSCMFFVPFLPDGCSLCRSYSWVFLYVLCAVHTDGCSCMFFVPFCN